MKINKSYIQTLIFIFVYLFAIYFWSQPYQVRKLRYGEYDAMSHFEVADYMAYNDKSIVKLPPYIDLRYGLDNKFKPHTLWYPPTFHASLGVIEVIGGERVLPVFLLNTIMATFVIVTVYFVINSLFGFLPAILSSLLIIFSPRDYMPYIWGQWPERFGYAFVPIVLYCFYKYFTTYSKESSKPAYLYLTSLFLIINLLVHPLVFFHSAFGLLFLYAFLAIKQKKLALNWKHIFVSALIFLALFMLFPYQTFNLFPSIGRESIVKEGSQRVEQKGIDLSRLFHWSFDPKYFEGSVPASYFSFSQMHGMWTLPFLLLGILFLLLRRTEGSLFLLAWLVSLYFVLHRDLAGITFFLHRSLSATQHIFGPITTIGAVYLASFIKLPTNYARYIGYAGAAFLVYMALSVNMASASKMLNKNVYSPETLDGFFVSLNSAEYGAAQWVLDNTPGSSNITVLGIPSSDNYLSATSKKIRWFAAVSQRVTRFYDLRPDKEAILKSPDWYIMLDYTMVGPLNDKDMFDQMQLFEQNNLANHTLVYNKDNIRVYRSWA